MFPANMKIKLTLPLHIIADEFITALSSAARWRHNQYYMLHNISSILLLSQHSYVSKSWIYMAHEAQCL